MQLTITGRTVTIVDTNVVGFEQDNLVQAITATVDTEEGYEFVLKYYMNTADDYNTIFFTRQGNVVYAVLTADMIPVGGRYTAQFEMSKGMMVLQSDVFDFYVDNGVNLDKVWTPIPTTFTQLTNNIQAMYQHPPIPGSNGFWMTWDLADAEYKESTYPLPSATGLPDVTTADNGKVLTVVDGVWTLQLPNQGG